MEHAERGHSQGSYFTLSTRFCNFLYYTKIALELKKNVTKYYLRDIEIEIAQFGRRGKITTLYIPANQMTYVA